MSSNRSNPDDIIPLLRNEMDVSYSHAPVSPKTLAFERLKLDIDELGASQRLDERIAFVETELNHLQTSWKSSAQTPELWTAHYEQRVSALQSTMNTLKAEKATITLDIRQKQHALDESIEKLDAARVEEMRLLLEKVKLIQIHYSDGKMPKSRRIRPVKLFSELLEQIKSMFVGNAILEICTREGDVIGSQDELFFAYQFVKEQILHLQVELKNPACTPVNRPKKRRRAPSSEEDEEKEEEEEEDSGEDVVPPAVIRNSGVWTTSEMIRFEEGVKRFGWGEWSLISNYVQTRDRKQVFKFSTTDAGQKAKRIPSVVHAYVDLAKGMSLVAEHLGTHQEAEARNRKRFKPNSLQEQATVFLSSSSSEEHESDQKIKH